jgi:hypothetical protein
MRTPRWLSYVTVAFSFCFILPGVFLVFAAPATILGLYSSFGIEPIGENAASALVYAFQGLQARNIGIALMTLFVAFRDLRVVLLLWVLRLVVETGDLCIALAQGEAGAGLLPVIGGFIALEVFVIGLGYKHYRQAIRLGNIGGMARATT